MELAKSAGAEVAGTLFQMRDAADPATLVGRGKLDEIRAEANATPCAADYFRQRTDADAAAQHRKGHGAASDRPHAIDPGHFCEACAEPRRTVAGGTGATELHAAAADRARHGNVPVGRQERRRRIRRRRRRSGAHRRTRTRRKEIGNGPAANPRPGAQDSGQHRRSAPAAGLATRSAQRRAAGDGDAGGLYERREIDTCSMH